MEDKITSEKLKFAVANGYCHFEIRKNEYKFEPDGKTHNHTNLHINYSMMRMGTKVRLPVNREVLKKLGKFLIEYADIADPLGDKFNDGLGVWDEK